MALPAGRRAQLDMYQSEHNEMFAVDPRRQADQQRREGRREHPARRDGPEAAYTGEVITWEQAMKSRQKLVPDLRLGDAPIRPVPGRG